MRPGAVIFAAIDLNALNRTVAAAGLPSGSTFTVVDSEGTVVETLGAFPATDPVPAHLRQGAAGSARPHESAVKHVTGRAAYIDDIAAPADCLHLALGLSPVAHGRLTRLDLEKVREMPGVVDVIAIGDVPGHTDIGPVFPGDPIFVEEEISYVGQVLFAVAAESHRAAREAVRAAVVEIDEQPASLDPVAAAERGEVVRPTHVQQSGDWEAALAGAAHVVASEQFVGGQEHFYLEGQACLVTPTEDEGVVVYTSNQHPSETQKLVAEVLGIPIESITVVHPDTDVTALAEGYITVTPLQFDLTHFQQLREMTSWQWRL